MKHGGKSQEDSFEKVLGSQWGYAGWDCQLWLQCLCRLFY